MDVQETEQITLEIMHLAVQAHMVASGLDPNSIQCRATIGRASRLLCMELAMEVGGQRLGVLQHPRDWWQSFKARWFPRWVLRRWPVQYRQYDLSVYYPRLALPKQEHVFRIEERSA